MTVARSNSAKRKGKPAPSSQWEQATRAERPKGGGILSPSFHSLAGGSSGVAQSVFDDNGQIRDLHGGQFGGNAFVRFGLSLSDKEMSERPYEENFVVRAALKAFSSGMAQLPFQLWDGPPSSDDSEEILEHPLLNLLATPNRMQSGKELVVSHTTDYKLDGDVFWFLMNAMGEPVQVNEATGKITEFPKQIVSIRGERVEHKVDKAGFPTEFRYKVGSQNNSTETDGFSHTFPWLSVIQFREYDPDNFVRGLGDVQSLTREIDLMFQAYRYLDASVKNGGDPGGFIIYDESVGHDELDARQATIDDTFGSDQAGRYRILDRKAKFIPNPTTPKDMEYMSLFEWALKAICSGVGVPPPIIGFLEDATLANYDSARREMWSGANGILSHAATRQDVMRSKLIDRLEGTPEMRGQGMDDLFPYYNPSGIEVLKKDRTDQLLKAAQVAAAGVGVSYNEALKQAELGVDPAEDGDTAYVHSALREVGEPSSAAVSMEAAKGGGTSKAADRADRHGGGRTVWVEMPSRCRAEDADPEIRKRAKGWLDSYEKNIIARLRVYANGGRLPDARMEALAARAFDPEKLTEADLKHLVLNEEQWAAAMERTMKVPVKGAWADGLSAAHGAVGGPFIAATDPRVVNMIADQLLHLSEGVTSATSHKVRSAILRVLSGADKTVSLREAIRQSLPELTKEMRSVFGSNHARALTISTTETNRATNQSNHLQMGEAGVSKKRWRTNSSNVRPSHMIQQNAGEIAYDAKFPNGGLHPHDPSLPAAEVVNCICSLEAAAFEDDLLDE